MNKIYVVKRYNNSTLAHSGKKGMKWGYNDGKLNGKRIATEDAYVDKNGEVLRKKSGDEFNKIYGYDKQQGYGQYVNERADGTRNTLQVTKSKDWLSSTETGKNRFGDVTIKEVGRLEQSMLAAKTWMNKMFK